MLKRIFYYGGTSKLKINFFVVLLAATCWIFNMLKILPDSELEHLSKQAFTENRDTILITGGMGNIGKYVVRELLFQGYSVVSLDLQDLTEELIELLHEKGMDERILEGPAFHFHKGDIRDVKSTCNNAGKPQVHIVRRGPSRGCFAGGVLSRQ